MNERKHQVREAKLQFEQLESRLPLAGNVTVALSGKTDLKITGDSVPNDVSIAVVGTNWVVTGNNGTTVTFNGSAGPTANVPEPAGSHFRNVTIDLKTAASPGADALAMAGTQVLGNLTIKGKNAGVVTLGGPIVPDGIHVAGKTAITFGNGASAGGAGTTVSIAHSDLGPVPQPGKKGKDLAITTGTNDDQILMTDTTVGGNITINAKDGRNTVALLGTRSDNGVVVNSSTVVSGNLNITTGAGNDNVGLLGMVLGGNLKVATGKGDDFHAAGGVVIKGTTSITSTDGNDVAVIGLRDVNGHTLLSGNSNNQMLGKVTVNLGKGNDLAVATDTSFGSSVTATLGAGDDTLAEDGNIYSLGEATALKGCRGGANTTGLPTSGDNLLSSVGLLSDAKSLKTGQFEKVDLAALPGIIDSIFTRVSGGFGDILLAYGINIGTPPDGNSDPHDQIGEALSAAVGSSNPGTLNSSVDVEMYSTSVTAGQLVTFDLTPTGFTAVLRLFDSTGHQLAIADTGPAQAAQRLQFTFATAGTFFVSVSSLPNLAFNPVDGTGDAFGGGSGAYTLTVTDGLPPDPDDQESEAPALSLGVFVNGQINSSTDVNMYRFNKVVGNSDFITVFPVDHSLDILVRVFDASGNQVASADSGGQGFDEQLSLASSLAGPIFIGISSYPNDSYDALTGLGDIDGDTTGGYTLRVTS